MLFTVENILHPQNKRVLLKDGAVIPPVSVLSQKINLEGFSDECKNYLL